MAGVALISQQQPLDEYGKIVPGARAYFYAAGSVTPLTVYADASFAVSLSNPVVANGSGLFPAIFLKESDSYYRCRVTTPGGTVLPGRDIDGVPIVGPAAGGSAPPAVDQNGLSVTGDMLASMKTGARSGWVRANGRTLGSAASGAAERANADCQLLYEMLWALDSTNLIFVVAAGRGASATADFTANKTITLPDLRGRALVGVDDMGGAAAGRLTNTTATPNGTTMGASGGVQANTLLKANLPAVALTLTGVTAVDGAHTHTTPTSDGNNNAGGGGADRPQNTDGVTGGTGVHQHALTGNTEVMGSATPLANMPPFSTATVYIRL